MTPNALLLLSTHSSSGGYGSLHGSMSQESEADLRPRSFSALGEANSVTSSAKQPNKEVCQRHTMKSSLADLLYEILTLIPILCFTGNKTKRSVYETTHTNGMSNPLKHISVKWHQCLLRRMWSHRRVILMYTPVYMLWFRVLCSYLMALLWHLKRGDYLSSISLGKSSWFPREEICIIYYLHSIVWPLCFLTRVSLNAARTQALTPRLQALTLGLSLKG